ncbi:chaplin [Streptomyces sp. NPDC050448]|uniref:chaplin n=1 Tax=Streptomyces sp. NPDC050448 TaxID=3155404 RepID=UPI00344A022A
MKIRTLAVAACLVVGATLGGIGAASADATAEGYAIGSPGFLSGNVIQFPTHIPINVCGNGINYLGVLNPTGGNTCINA